MTLSAYLLRESTEELIEELREDEAHILERERGSESGRNKVRKGGLNIVPHSTLIQLLAASCLDIWLTNSSHFWDRYQAEVVSKSQVGSFNTKQLKCMPSISVSSKAHLVEEVLHQLSDADVVEMSMHQQHLLQVFELWDCIVAVPRCLATLLTHDALRGREGLVD